MEMLREPSSTRRASVCRVCITPEPHQHLHDGQDGRKSNPGTVILQGSLTQSFHGLDLLESCKHQPCSWEWPCKLPESKQEVPAWQPLDYQNVLEAQNRILAPCAPFPSPALYYRDASVLPRDLLSGCNINLGNIPSARELYKVHSPRCLISLCREYPW